jgi:hypothetical protein
VLLVNAGVVGFLAFQLWVRLGHGRH